MRARIIGSGSSGPPSVLNRGTTTVLGVNSSSGGRQVGHTLANPDPDRFMFLMVGWYGEIWSQNTNVELAPPGWSLTDGGPYTYNMTQHYLFQQNGFTTRACLGIWSFHIPEGTGTVYVWYPTLQYATGDLHVYRCAVKMPNRVIQSVSSTYATNATLTLNGNGPSIALVHGYVYNVASLQYNFSSAVNGSHFSYNIGSWGGLYYNFYSGDRAFTGSYTADLDNDAANKSIRMVGVVI